MTEEIRNLEDFLADFIEPNDKIISSNVERLTAPGENYLSLVLKVDVTLLNQESSIQKQFSGVAKCFNPRKENEEEKFRTFEKENYISELTFYKDIVPTLSDFANEKDLAFDIFPSLIGYRPNLHGKTGDVDDDSIILLENLKLEGYRNVDRHIGFGFDDAKIILRDLALFHSVPVALKLKNRQLFEKKIKKNLQRIPFIPPERKIGEEYKSFIPLGDLDVYFDILEDYSQCKLYIRNLRNLKEYYRKNLREIFLQPKSEPFATISHNDVWVNNTMQVIEENKIISNKFVDFQIHTYDSPVGDIIFFIGTSVQLPVIRQHFDDFIKFYHQNFLETLTKLGCMTGSFSYEKFQDELRKLAWKGLFDVIMFHPVVFGKKGEESVDMEKRLQKEDVTDIMRERAATLVQIFGRRGWL